MEKLKVISLFSGYGTQELALKYCGINHTTVAHCDILPAANTTFEALHKTEFGNLGDITKLHEKDLPSCDLLTYSFPCFTKNTLVLTDVGYKTINNIAIGDKVLTHTNTYKNVSNIFDQGKKEIWKVVSSSVDSIETTENHRFYVRSKNGGKKFELTEPYWKECKDLTKDDYLGVAINQNSIIPTWEGIDSMGETDFWWLMGLYFNSGVINSNDGGIIICCTSKTDLVLNLITNKLRGLNFNYTISLDGLVYKIHIPKKELGEFVKQFEESVHGKRLTNTIIDLPKNLLESFIYSYQFVDGSMYVDATLHRICSVNKELIYGIGQCIAKVYNIPYSIYKTVNTDKYIIEGREVNHRDLYTITYDFLDVDFDGFDSFYEDGYIWNPIRTVENTHLQDDVYDIEVEEDHSFTANGCIAHNCQDISISGVQKGIKRGTRSGLLFEVERLVEYNKPKYLLMENVKNLTSKNHMPAFNEFIEKLETLGYGNSWVVLNGADFGCPQNRERVFMISVLGETSENVNKTMEGVYKHKKERVSMRPYIENTDDTSLFLNVPFEMNTPKMASVCRLVARRSDINYDQTRRIYGLDGCSPCLTTSGSPQIMLDDGRIRTLTAREGYRFMGVRDEDIDTLLTTRLSTKQHIALAGNSICVPVMEAIFSEFFSEYRNNDIIEKVEKNIIEE